MVFDQGFCKNLLLTKKDYFQFVHIMLIEYFDSILQYVSCFETKGNVFSFPFENFLKRYKRRIPFVKKCLNSLNSEKFLENCWFLCNKFSLIKLSPFFDGDLKLIKRVYLAIFSFTRKFHTSVDEFYNPKKRTKDHELEVDVDGMLIEPLNASHLLSRKYYLEDKTRKDVLGTLDTRIRLPNAKIKDQLNKAMIKMGFGSVDAIIKNFNDVQKQKYELALTKKKLNAMEKKISPKDKKKIDSKLKHESTAFGQKIVNYLLEDTERDIHEGYYPRKLETIEGKKNFGVLLINSGLPQDIVERKLGTTIDKKDLKKRKKKEDNGANEYKIESVN